MSVINNGLLLGAGADGYQISRSVRLRSSASAYFNRTPASTTNQKVMTFSAWVKRGTLSSSGLFPIFGNAAASPDYIGFYQDSFRISFSGGTYYYQTSAVYRDSSAWYHIVVSLDTTQATAANRVLLWINGIAVTSFTSSVIPQNGNTSWNLSGTASYIGQVSSNYLDGYITEINFIDGQALTPSSFGETDTLTGVWKPKKYAGTYGTNGFYLNFSDNSAATAAAIGKDNSGNGNNWTPNNISVTAGVTYDSMLDVPTPYADGGNGRGNYPVWNPLDVTLTKATISNGNLTATGATGQWVISNFQLPTSGKYYAEFTLTASTDTNAWIGPRLQDGSVSVIYVRDGRINTNGSTTTTVATYAAGALIGVAVDAGANTVTFYKNNTQVYSGAIATAAGTLFSAYATSSTWNANFGQRPFTYTPPTGFVALNTQNLPTPTISNGASYMAATTYTGTGATQTINNSANGVSFQPDLVWVKGRSGATDHAWYDAVRGVQKQLESNTTTAETTETTGLTAFGTTGFTIGALAQMNTNTATYVGWQWNAGGSTVTNTSGSISAQVRANATAGFSVVTYTGNGTNGSTIGHGLGVAPSMIIVKGRSTTDGWPVYHTSIANTQSLRLNTTAAVVTAGFWNNTTAGSSVFTVGGGTVSETNTTSATYVAYCFAAVAGYSAFGSYTGNGSADGPFVFTGFRPRFVLIKESSSTGSWYMYDTARDAYNVMDTILEANYANAETTASTLNFDIVSNGFKIRGTNGDLNTSTSTYIYAAFAENPFKHSLAR